jgi:hypothetical protein
MATTMAAVPDPQNAKCTLYAKQNIAVRSAKKRLFARRTATWKSALSRSECDKKGTALN